MFVGACAGFAVGATYGIVLVCATAPTVDPQQPLRHEWYTVAAVGLVFCAALCGALVGVFLSFAPARRGLPGGVLGSLTGLLLGTVAGFVFWGELAAGS